MKKHIVHSQIKPPKIEIQIPEDAIQKDPTNVDLLIIDPMGNHITEVMHTEVKPGVYDVDIDDPLVSDGDYFYKLIYEDVTETKKTGHIF